MIIMDPDHAPPIEQFQVITLQTHNDEGISDPMIEKLSLILQFGFWLLKMQQNWE